MPPRRRAFVLLVLAFALWPPRAPAQIREIPAQEVEDLLNRLQDIDPDVRRIAAIQVRNLPGTAYEAIEKASRDGSVDAGARAALQGAVPFLRARARQTKFHRENYQDNLRSALEAYDQVGKKDPKWDALAREAIALMTKPPALRPKGETDQTVVDAFKKAIDAGCDDPFILYLSARAEIVLPNIDRPAVLRRHRHALFALAESNYPADRKLGAAARYAKEFDTPEPVVMQVCMKYLAETVSPKTPRRRGYISELVDMTYQGLSKVRGKQEAFEEIYPAYAKGRPAEDPVPHGVTGSRD